MRSVNLLSIAFSAAVLCGSFSAASQAQDAEIAWSPENAAQPATVDGCEVIARVNGQVVLACEVLWQVNRMLEENRDKIPPDKYEQIRDQLMKRTLTGIVDQKLIFGEFRRNVPPENMPRIEQNLLPHFEKQEIPRLMKQLDCQSQRELEQELSRLGSSLADTRQSFNEHVIASEWLRSKVKINDEVSPDEMLDYYRNHRAEFEYPTQARWEELMVRKSGVPTQAQQAYAKLAQMGNEVWPRLATNPPADTPVFREVAQAKSEGYNAQKDGGLHDWTEKGSLKATVVDESIFSLPVGQMSPILDSGTAFHIVRVLERKEAGCQPFTDVQNDIREKLRNQRLIEAQRKYIAGLRRNAKIWTVYTGNISAEALFAEIPRNTKQR